MHRELAPEVRLENVSVGYPGRIVLHDLNVVLPGGKVSVILGGSGGGKSTLLRHLLGLSQPSAGRILFGGRELTALGAADLKAFRRRMGVLFQDGALLGSLTLAQNVALPLLEHTDLPPEVIEEVVRLKLGLVDLDPYMEYYPSQLSGGMRKRAGLARAMVMDPQILFCDEPSSGLDPITAAELDQLILDLNATFDMTIVVVTHDLDSLFTIADHVVVLHAGRAAYQGSLDGLLTCGDAYIDDFINRRPVSRRNPAGAPGAPRTGRPRGARAPR